MRNKTTRKILPAMALGAIALGISALLPASPTVEAGPDPCPPDDPAVFFYDCFDLGDMNGQDEALPGDSSDNVDSDNYDNQWDEVEGASQDCKINFEELLLSSVGTIGFGCSAVTSPVVTVSGYSEVTVSFAWGGQGAVLVPPPSLSVYLDQGSGFTQIGEALILPLPSTCDSVGLIGLVTCADFDANIPVTLADCGEHQLRLRFNGPAFVGGVSLLAYVDDVRIVGTSQEGCDAAGDDDPALPNINVTKVCVGGSPSATFAISIGSQTENVPCGGTTTLNDAEPGAYTISETIGGSDAGAFSTTIVCSTDNTPVSGPSTSVAIPEEGGVDISCVVINAFGGGVAGIIAPPVNIEIDNANTNVVGVDNANTNGNANNNGDQNENDNTNENANNNVNTNTQDQANEQDQDNTNEQTNNIDASPVVNIDLAD